MYLIMLFVCFVLGILSIYLSISAAKAKQWFDFALGVSAILLNIAVISICVICRLI